MANLKKTVYNPNFCEEAGEYLEANGFNRMDSKMFDDSIYYAHNAMAVIIFKDTARFMMRHDEEDDRGLHYSCFAAFEGIHQLELFDWMLLFHITKLLPMKDFIKNVKQQEPQLSSVSFINDIMKHFEFPNNPVPANY